MIVPSGEPNLGPSLSTNQRTRLPAWEKKLLDVWFSIQITHYGGKYSIERMLALEEYTNKTSLFRVLLVILATPLPTIGIVLCQELIPLQSPTAGWSANWGFWLRMIILGTGSGIGTTIQSKYLLDGVKLSWLQILWIALSVGVGHTAVAMLVAAFWAFPVPFVSFTLSMVLFALYVAAFRVAVGVEGFRRVLSQRKQLQRGAYFFMVQMLMVCIYPAYQVLFNFANDTNYELPVLLLLPVMKLVLKNILTFTLLHKEDTIPEQVIFAVDFFDALYLTMCMQSASSSTAVVLIIAIDVAQIAIDLYDLRQRRKHILPKNCGVISNANLLAAARSLCDQLNLLQAKTPEDIQLYSCIPHPVADTNRNLLDRFDKHSDVEPYDNSLLLSNSIVHAVSAASLVSSSKRRISRGSTIQSAPSHSRPAFAEEWRILHKTLEMLFTAECLVLTEYLEAIVPIFYGIFVMALASFPSVHYKEMIGVTPGNVIHMLSYVFIYATLELISFIGLLSMMWQTCGIQPLYQLAFVLETQTSFLQSKMILWVLVTLTYRVAHFGVDYSFQFAWLHGKAL